MDGLTTNGVLVMHPEGFPEDPKQGLWREISVCGDVYALRETRSGPSRGKLVSFHVHTLLFKSIKVAWFIFGLMVSVCLSMRELFQAEGESSALRDGSLVDLCGATLLWRTGEGLMRAPTLRHLEALRQELNASRPQCPVGLSTLAFPSLPRSHRWGLQSVVIDRLLRH
uniref:Pellino FHA domain-containing protein n=1 Tax=Seriola lalandi dorsalis TaxID=1841481 RepID=A0A3B4WBH9_SERLL